MSNDFTMGYRPLTKREFKDANSKFLDAVKNGGLVSEDPQLLSQIERCMFELWQYLAPQREDQNMQPLNMGMHNMIDYLKQENQFMKGKLRKVAQERDYYYKRVKAMSRGVW